MDEIAEYALKLAETAGDYAEVYLEHSVSYSFAIEQGLVNGGGFSDEVGLRVRFLKKGSMYTVSTNKLSKSVIADLIKGAKPLGASTVLSPEKREKANYKERERKPVSSESMLDTLLSIDKSLKDNKKVKFRSVYGGFGRDVTYFKNSEGSEIRSSLPITNTFISLIIGERGETRQRFLQFGGTGGYEVLDEGSIVRKLESEIKGISNVISKGISLSSSDLKKIKNIVISSEISGIAVHESIGHPNEADRVFGRESAQAGESYVTGDNLGMRIGSEAITIIDDPTIKNSYGFFLYDDEAVKARPKIIVENGVQKELLLNREYAGMLGIKSNGSARSSSYANEPLVRMSNTYLKGGNATFDDLLKEARNGIYVKSFTEWNIDDTRSFARYRGNEAYLIKNGSIEEPVKNYVIETTTQRFWSSVTLVDKNVKYYLGECGKGEPMQGLPVTMGGGDALLEFD
ncbi:MAG: TldD/PmbA family protein [Candidatus Micrarchaeaceae archaeon]